MDLEKISRYVASPELVEVEDLTPMEQVALPDYWLNALTGDTAFRVSETLSQWNNFGRPILGDTYRNIKETLTDVRLLKSQNRFFLLYDVKMVDGTDLHYLGGAPVSEGDELPAYWNKFPPSLKNFYANLHNGWYYVAGKTVGPLPLEDMFRIDSFEWSILDGLSPDEYPDPSRCVATFRSGGGGYLCLHFGEEATKGVVWSSTEPPELVDYSTYLDIWTNVGLGA
ncbi:SMI1/KNR4 family protein [Rhodococcus sp. OK302]|uniref:SMI1/KNR4 family protein n=1 Tax=Rhodococcus sp. OK302 TaxID=1882769 RepID=UPI000B944648|nr:SMI1/KNR4 family protein [Rhodococcus sp. OK302]OYD61208.1 hypothetical protein BDB13_6165 [Rhodococcus sp. OK302]